MLNKIAVAAPFIALGIASPTVAYAQSLAADGTECRTPQGWQDVTEREPHYVVFGELHGTEQGPHFVGSLACALVQNGESILIAIEHSAMNDPALQAAWNTSDESFEERLAGVGWFGRRDGVASVAMFNLVTGLHRLKERGLPISIVAFNGLSDEEQFRRLSNLPGQGPHEAAQAENIRNAALSGDYDRVLVLVGNLHARKDLVDRYGPAFEPMARRLSRYGRVVSLDMSYGKGSSWNCILKPGVVFGKPIGDKDIECGAQPTPGTATYEQAPFIKIDPTSEEDASEPYDGFFWVGPVSASPPKVLDSQ